MIRSSAASLALGLLAALQAPLLTACRGGLNAVCHCASDCRDGLVCEAEGEKTLSAEMCFAPGVNGRCVEAEGLDTDGEEPLVATEPPMLMDLPSNRDFQPGESVSDSASAGTTTPTTGTATDATDTGTSTSSTSSTGTTTGTSTGTTADTDTSTGTTGPGSTGTTTDTSSSSGSSSSGESSSSGSSSSTTGP